MMNHSMGRTLHLTCLLVGGFALAQPTSVHAFSFATPVLSSHLGEPLDVRIPFALDADENMNKVFIDLVKKEMYQQWGLVPYIDLSTLHLSVKREKNSAFYVEINSSIAMQEPIVSFVLEAREGLNHYYKHVRLMLDPIHAYAPPYAKPTSVLSVNKSRIHTKRVTDKAFVAKDSKDDGWARVWRYGPVRSGDSLSTIAYRLRKDKRWSNHKVMLGLYRANLDAFVDENMNDLKSGVWLDVPHKERLKKLLAQSPSQQEIESLHPSVKKATAIAAKKAAAPSYVGHIAMGDVRITPKEKDLLMQNDAMLKKKLEEMYQKSMSSHIRMDSLDQSLDRLNQHVTAIQKSVASLHVQQVDVEQKIVTLESVKEGTWQWRLGLLALFILNALGLAFLYWKYVKREPDIWDDDSEKMSVDVTGLAAKSAVLPASDHNNTLDNHIYDIEHTLDGKDYKMAEVAFAALNQEQRNNARISALQTRFYHETRQVTERDDYVRKVRRVLNEPQWRMYCDHLPANIWKSLTVAGVVEGANFVLNTEEDTVDTLEHTVMMKAYEKAPTSDDPVSEKESIAAMEDLGFVGIPTVSDGYEMGAEDDAKGSKAAPFEMSGEVHNNNDLSGYFLEDDELSMVSSDHAHSPEPSTEPDDLRLDNEPHEADLKKGEDDAFVLNGDYRMVNSQLLSKDRDEKEGVENDGQSLDEGYFFFEDEEDGAKRMAETVLLPEFAKSDSDFLTLDTDEVFEELSLDTADRDEESLSDETLTFDKDALFPETPDEHDK